MLGPASVPACELFGPTGYVRQIRHRHLQQRLRLELLPNARTRQLLDIQREEWALRASLDHSHSAAPMVSLGGHIRRFHLSLLRQRRAAGLLGGWTTYLADNGADGQIGAGDNVNFLPFDGGVDEVAFYTNRSEEHTSELQ